MEWEIVFGNVEIFDFLWWENFLVIVYDGYFSFEVDGVGFIV